MPHSLSSNPREPSALFAPMFTPATVSQERALRLAPPQWAAPAQPARTAHPLATLAAIETLKRGDSAVDAAVTANACLGFLEPTSSGIGGDCYAMLWDP